MSAHDAPLDIVAFQLAAALEKYEHDAGLMVDTWLDMELYRSVSEQVESLRMMSAALPQLSVPWVELLITHVELVHSLWRLRFHEDDLDRVKLLEVRARHLASVESMRARCLRMLARAAGRVRPADLTRG